MAMKKGFYGMFALTILIIGFMAFSYVQGKRDVTNSGTESLAHELRTDRIALLRNVILKSHDGVTPDNEMAWSSFVQGELAPEYGLDVYFDYSSVPAKVTVWDGREGARSEFFLVS